MNSELNYDEIKAEAQNMLRDTGGIYSQELDAGLRASVRRMRQEGVLASHNVFTFTLGAGTNDLIYDEMRIGVPMEIDRSVDTGPSPFWARLQKMPEIGADFRARDDYTGLPTKWAVQGDMIMLDYKPQNDIFLRVWTEYTFLGNNQLPALSAVYYDFVLQYTVLYVQKNYLNVDSTAAEQQAQKALDLLLAQRSRVEGTRTIQPFIY